MRPWRRLHAGIITSDKVAAVSDGAALLFVLLIAAQDDRGCYPWTPAKIRALCVGRSWRGSKTATFIKELVASKLVEFVGECPDNALVHIVGGELKNGKPHNVSAAFHYDASDAARVVRESARVVDESLETQDVSLDQIRSDQRREERESAGAAWADAFEGGPPPPPPVIAAYLDHTPREAACTKWWRAYPQRSGGHWGAHEAAARQAWREHVGEDEEAACLAKLEDYKRSKDVQAGVIMAPENWLLGWREQTAAKPAAPASAKDRNTAPNYLERATA